MTTENQLEGKLDYNLPYNYSDDPRFSNRESNCTLSGLKKNRIIYSLRIYESEEKCIRYIAYFSDIKVVPSKDSPLSTVKANVSLRLDRLCLKEGEWKHPSPELDSWEDWTIWLRELLPWTKKKPYVPDIEDAEAEYTSYMTPELYDGLSDIIVDGHLTLGKGYKGDYTKKVADQLKLDFNFVAKMFQPLESLLMEWYTPQLEKQAKEAEEKLKKYYESRK